MDAIPRHSSSQTWNNRPGIDTKSNPDGQIYLMDSLDDVQSAMDRTQDPINQFEKLQDHS